MKSALNVFRIILLDQRGTGLSTPVTQLSLARQGSPAEQAQYLRHFRCCLHVHISALTLHHQCGPMHS